MPKVKSSMIEQIEWAADPSSSRTGFGILYVMFIEGTSYKYYNVPKGIYEKLIDENVAGRSVGSFFDIYVKKAGYKYEKTVWPISFHERRSETLYGILNEEVARLEKKSQSIEEDYTGRQREFYRQELIRFAVEIADRCIVGGADGSEEELDFLTCEIAQAFNKKVEIALMSKLRRKELLETIQSKEKEKQKA